MLKVLEDFRKILSSAMLPAMHRRVILYGDGYTGRFLKWYAEYYHNIKVDYIISCDWRSGQSYEEEIFRPTLLWFDYKDSKDAIIWLAVPLDDKLEEEFKKYNFIDGKNLVNFYNLVYGEDVLWDEIDEEREVYKRKTGVKDIQFLEWLEWKYDCNFVTAVENKFLSHSYNSYRCTTQKEIFPLLDKCHIEMDMGAIFDFGCGKGGAMVSFCDYGFSKVGGVEYDSALYEILDNNMKKLQMFDDVELELIKGDAGLVKEPLDKYSIFYFFQPFDDAVFTKCIKNIEESIKRRKRKIRIIYINPYIHKVMDGNPNFQLVNQFTISTRQRVVNVWENIAL